jgi:putative heme iron utilization protein
MTAQQGGEAAGGDPQPGASQQKDSRPDHGLAARRIMRGAASASLATAGEGGQPFVSLVTPAIAADGAVLLWLSTLSEHTRQLLRDPRCGLLFRGPAEDPNPQTAPRVSITGQAERVEDAGLKAHWLARHPYAAIYADFADFSLWRVVPQAGLMVLGFGRAHRLRAAELAPDPAAVAALAAAEPAIRAKLAAEPGLPAALARRLGGPEGEWQAGALSPDGCDLVEHQTGQVLFLGFPQVVSSEGGLLSALQHGPAPR